MIFVDDIEVWNGLEYKSYRLCCRVRTFLYSFFSWVSFFGNSEIRTSRFLRQKPWKSPDIVLCQVPGNKLFEYCFEVKNCSVFRSDRGKKQHSNICKKQYYPSFPLCQSSWWKVVKIKHGSHYRHLRKKLFSVPRFMSSFHSNS